MTDPIPTTEPPLPPADFGELAQRDPARFNELMDAGQVPAGALNRRRPPAASEQEQPPAAPAEAPAPPPPAVPGGPQNPAGDERVLDAKAVRKLARDNPAEFNELYDAGRIPPAALRGK